MRFVLVTTGQQLLDTQVEEVYAPGVCGQFGVLPQHTTFLTALSTGELRYREAGRDRYLALSGGVCEVRDDVVTILADSAEFGDQIDVDRARAAQQRAESALEDTPPESDEGRIQAAALERAMNRLEVALKRSMAEQRH